MLRGLMRLSKGDEDFEQSGLKVTSVIRVGQLAVVAGEILLGAMRNW